MKLQTEAADEIDRLRERLECNHVFQLIDGKMTRVESDLAEEYDGIACRDETIRLQDRTVADLRAANAQMLEALKHMLGAIDGGHIDSEQVDGNERDGIPPHKWHEEWASIARAAIAKAEAA